MTASDKKKSAILVLLVIVAIGTWRWRMGAFVPATTTPATATKAVKKPTDLKSPADAQIRTDWLEGNSVGEVGHRNLFAYRPKPLPPKPVEVARPVFTQPVSDPVPVKPPVVVPPPVPFKAFRYDGFSVNRNTKKLLGSITESGNSYKVSEGECIMGQYCIVRLTEGDVEIEDLQLKRKQTFKRTQQ